MITLTLPDEEMELLKEKAAELGVTVEQYVCRLIWKDLMTTKDLLGAGQN
jgi:predicted DNA binding CopG/RHH family protein